MRRWIGPAILCCLCGLFGCGGNDSNSPPPRSTPLKISIQWGARSRAVSAPSSALSATVTLTMADPTGADFTWTLDRDTNPAAYTANYVSAARAKVGAAPLRIGFYAQADGKGALVGEGQANVTIQADGSGIGPVTTINTVASVEVAADQSLLVGQKKDLVFTAKDAKGAMVAVTPGSAFLTVKTGGDLLRVTGGQLEGVSAGLATVTATVDGRASAETGLAIQNPLPRNYALTDLGVPAEYADSAAVGINNAGQVAGNITRAEAKPGSDPHVDAFFWQSGRMTAIPQEAYYNDVVAINASGQVLIYGRDPYGFGLNAATLWRKGQQTSTGSFTPNALNDRGQVSGVFWIPPDAPYFVLWDGTDKVTKLPIEDDFTIAGMNSAGQIVGTSSNPAHSGNAMIWQNGSLLDLGRLPGDGASSPALITNAGEVLGTSSGSGGVTHVFLWQKGQMTRLGSSLPGLPYVGVSGINASGQVVGGMSGGSADQPTASHVLLLEKGQIYDLNAALPANSGWVLTSAAGINDNGWIAGTGLFQGKNHAFVLIPQ
jgi:probable HAF family extracellular repeat protein